MNENEYYLVTNKNKIGKLKMMGPEGIFMINHKIDSRLK